MNVEQRCASHAADQHPMWEELRILRSAALMRSLCHQSMFVEQTHSRRCFIYGQPRSPGTDAVNDFASRRTLAASARTLTSCIRSSDVAFNTSVVLSTIHSLVAGSLSIGHYQSFEA